MKDEDFSLFVDRDGSKNSESEASYTQGHNLPLYTSNLHLTNAIDRIPEELASGTRAKIQGFATNWQTGFLRKDQILRSHMLGSHTTPKMISGKSRYHNDDERRFSSMKPGSISKSLKDALGLEQNQLPLYIYRMRLLGYPPGHLESACCQRSGIVVFAEDGCEVTSSGNILEEGELNDETEQVAYDVNQLIDYPGFNTDPPPGTIEECERLHLPHMQAEQRKEVMVKKLLSTELETEKSCQVQIDLKKSQLSGNIHCSDSLSDREDERSDTPDKDHSGRSSGRPCTPAQTTSMPNALQSEGEHSVVQDSSLAEIKSPSFLQGFSTSEVVLETNDQMPRQPEDYGDSLVVASGTLVVADDAFWSCQLPDASRFSSGITEYLPYQNLPNSIGTFQKLRKVLKDARCRTESPYPRNIVRKSCDDTK